MRRVQEFLYDRGGSFYFRRAVPPEARGAFGGRREVLVSLKTPDLAEARLLLSGHLKDFEQKLAKATGRRDPSDRLSPSALAPTSNEIEAAVRIWLASDAERRPKVDRATAGARLQDLTAMSTVTASGFAFGGDQPNLQTRWIADAILDRHRWKLQAPAP